MDTRNRRIGAIGTVVRIGVGAAMVYGAFAIDGLMASEAFLGAVAFPGAVLASQQLRARRRPAPLRATGWLGHLVNNGIWIAFLLTPGLRDATLLFYGGSMLVAAARGYAGCEVLALSNWLLRRDDQVGCMLFSPLDALETRILGRSPSAAE